MLNVIEGDKTPNGKILLINKLVYNSTSLIATFKSTIFFLPCAV